MVFLVVPSPCGPITTNLSQDALGHCVLEHLSSSPHCYWTLNGRLLESTETFKDGDVIQIIPRLLGGKGGFGSLLRFIGSQIEKTTNHEACRDLSGRRMKDVNNEKKLSDWLSKSEDRERQKREKEEEKIRRLKEGPRHTFEDKGYFEARDKINEELDDALTVGLTSSKGSKRPAHSTDSGPAVKHFKDWLGVDPELIDSEEEEDMGEASGNTCTVTEDSPSTSHSTVENTSSSHSTVENTSSSHSTVDNASTSHSTVDNASTSQSTVENASTSQSTGENNFTSDSSAETMLKADLSKNNSCEIFNLVNETPPVNISPNDMKSTSLYGTGDACNLRLSSNDDYTLTELQIHECTGNKSKDFEVTHIKSTPSEVVSAMASKEGSTEVNISVPSESSEHLVDLNEFHSTAELAASLGLEGSKKQLSLRGLKCGGTLEERVERLFSIRGLASKDWDQSLFSCSSKKGRKRGGKG